MAETHSTLITELTGVDRKHSGSLEIALSVIQIISNRSGVLTSSITKTQHITRQASSSKLLNKGENAKKKSDLSEYMGWDGLQMKCHDRRWGKRPVASRDPPTQNNDENDDKHAYRHLFQGSHRQKRKMLRQPAGTETVQLTVKLRIARNKHSRGSPVPVGGGGACLTAAPLRPPASRKNRETRRAHVPWRLATTHPES